MPKGTEFSQAVALAADLVAARLQLLTRIAMACKEAATEKENNSFSLYINAD